MDKKVIKSFVYDNLMSRSGFDFLLSGTWAASLFASFVGGSFLSGYQSQNIMPLLQPPAPTEIVLTSSPIKDEISEETVSEKAEKQVRNPIPKADGIDEIENNAWWGAVSAIFSSSSIF